MTKLGKDNSVSKNEFKVQRCIFDWVDCTGNFDMVNVFDDFGKERECLRFNGGVYVILFYLNYTSFELCYFFMSPEFCNTISTIYL